MRVCSYATWALGILILAWGCAGSETPPAQGAEQTGGVDEMPADEPAPAAESEDMGSDEEGWEGENKAVSKAPAGAAAEAGDEEETRTLEVIQVLVKNQRQPVRQCYEAARKDDPSLKGDLVIHFVLDPDGKVKKAELNEERSTLKAPSIAKCAIDVIKQIKFPPSSRGMETTINYPYNLNP